VGNVFEQELVDNRGFIVGWLVVASIDHFGEFSGALWFRELGVKAVVHAVAKDDLKGGEVGVGSEYGPQLFHGAEPGSVP
jgi:hypothetical protein